MNQGERRPLLSTKRTISFIRQPGPERVGSYRSEHGAKTSHIRAFINSVNILIGSGILSLPLAFRYTGWALGVLLLSLSAVMTVRAALSLVECLDSDVELRSYIDVAGAAFGPRAQLFTSITFGLTVITACVALVVLFGDAMNLLVPSVTSAQWKMIGGAIILPMQFLSMMALAPLSMLGIVASISVVITIVIAGLVRHISPGSLLDPAPTSTTPTNYLEVCSSVGLFLAPWGATASVPTFYRAMRHPDTYKTCIVQSFTFCYLVNGAMAVVGYLMFGPTTSRAINYNVLGLSSPSYPHTLLGWLITWTALLPMTKITLRCAHMP